MDCAVDDMIVSLPSSLHGIRFAAVCKLQAVVFFRASHSHQS